MIVGQERRAAPPRGYPPRHRWQLLKGWKSAPDRRLPPAAVPSTTLQWLCPAAIVRFRSPSHVRYALGRKASFPAFCVGSLPCPTAGRALRDRCPDSPDSANITVYGVPPPPAGPIGKSAWRER